MEAAEAVLTRVVERDLDLERRVLLLIKHDELFGEILKAMHAGPAGGYEVSAYARAKLEQMSRVFPSESMRRCLQALYESDVIAKGRDHYAVLEVAEKLKAHR